MVVAVVVIMVIAVVQARDNRKTWCLVSSELLPGSHPGMGASGGFWVSLSCGQHQTFTSIYKCTRGIPWKFCLWKEVCPANYFVIVRSSFVSSLILLSFSHSCVLENLLPGGYGMSWSLDLRSRNFTWTALSSAIYPAQGGGCGNMNPMQFAIAPAEFFQCFYLEGNHHQFWFTLRMSLCFEELFVLVIVNKGRGMHSQWLLQMSPSLLLSR